MNNNRRLELLNPFITDHSSSGGINHFKNLDINTLKILMDEGFANPNESTNHSPTTKDYYEFLKRNPQFTAHGYVVDPSRDDCRITIEGIHFQGKVNIDQIISFINLARFADDEIVSKNTLFCWYD